MSPSRPVTRWSTSVARSRSSIAVLTSIPMTLWPRAARGIASRPVPTASSRIRAGRVDTNPSRNATVESGDGSERRGCTLLTFRSKGKLVDAGLEEMAFAPRVGPVRIVEQTIAGTRVKTLVARTVKR